jgi:hypothetical protein
MAPGPRTGIGVRRERTIRCNAGIAGRESGGTGRQESEGLIVPVKPANTPCVEPVEGRSAP